MNSQIAFGLEKAAWPALLVDERGVIARANAAAAAAFGPAISADPASLSAIWSVENGTPALEFLRRWEQTPMPVVMLKFCSASGAAMNFTTSISTFSKDNHKWFVLQLVLASVPTPTAALVDLSAAATAPAPAATPPPHVPPLNIPPLKMARSVPETQAPNALPGIEKEVLAPASPENKVSDASGLILKQKLDCALQLARTVSLDFNNALTSIMGHASFLLSKSEPGHPWRHSLMQIEKSASLAAEIANDLAVFSRQEKEVRRVPPGNVNVVLGRCVDFFRNAHGEKARWNLRLEKDLYVARFDEAKIQQVFTNIMENAFEALADRGEISVQTCNLELSEAVQDCNVRLSAGAYVCAEISDNGAGIAPEVLPRVFEPFFTTKTGNHRGLGLALVYGIITNHGGGVAISSGPGGGASVRVYLPAEKQLVNEHPGTPDDDFHGTGTILVVDDEEFLLTMTETILSEYGYRVLTASSGANALVILAGEESGIDLVVTDLVMPGMGGRELVERIGQLGPDTKIICMSGCVPAQGQQWGGAFLRKPFTSEELLSMVKHIISPNPALTSE